MIKFKRGLTTVGLTALSMSILMGAVSMPTYATPEAYTDETTSNNEEKIDSSLLPRGAKKDEKIEVIVQFKGNPVLKEYVLSKAEGKKLDKQSQKLHEQKLKNNKHFAKDKIEKNGGRIIDSFEKSYNGLYVQVKRSTLSEIVSLPEVQSIHEVKQMELHNDSSVNFIGTPHLWNKVVEDVHVTGKGIRVAVIDTGIDYTHASFGGAGTKEAYSVNNPDIVEPGSFPTAKVVGGYDFAGSNYDSLSSDPDKRIPKPDADPLDEHGHGTHVAGTAAGIGVDGKVGKGVAYDALLYAYKVFGKRGSTAVTAQAVEMAMDPNGDGDVSDHVDVINMSLGSDYGNDGPLEALTNLASDAGIIVVASAGNSGDVPYVTGAPATAEKAISVAASADDGLVTNGFQVNSPSSIADKYEGVEGAITTPLSSIDPVTKDVVYVGKACNTDALNENPEGKIALVDRGICGFTEKLTNVLNAKAAGVIVANDRDGAPGIMSGTKVAIPGLMVTNKTGDILKQALNEGKAVNVTLSDKIKVSRAYLADTMGAFSSKGPGRGAIGFKPEISAPGVDISSAYVGTGNESTSLSGTSMAAPHIAGVAALLRQLHPDWSTEEIKSLIMNTSKTLKDLEGKVYPLSRQGAGRVQVAAAAEATSVVSPQSLSLGYVPVSEEIKTEKMKGIKVTNKGNETKEYTVTWANRNGNQSGPVSLSVPTTLIVKAGKSEKFNVNFAIESAALSDEAGFHEFDGYVVLTDQNKEVIRIPYQAVVEKVSKLNTKVFQDVISLKNIGDTTSKTDLFVFGDMDAEEDNIEDYYNLKAVGSRVVNDRVEFNALTNQAWQTPNIVEFNVYIDTNMDGNPEYIVYNQDSGSFAGRVPTGKQITVLYDMATKKASAQNAINVGGSYHNNYIGMSIPKSLVGEQFQYSVESFGLDAEFSDTNDGGWIPFNTKKQNINFDANSFNILKGESVDVKVSLNTSSEKVMVVNNSDTPESTFSVLEFTALPNGKVKGKKIK